MTRAIVRSLLFICCVGVLFAQEGPPRADLFLGYSFLRANSAQDIPAFTANGGAGTLGLNFNNHIGLEFEFGGYHNGNIHDIQFDTTYLTYLFGPRFSLGRSRRIDPYIHVLFGGARITSSISENGTNLLGTPSASTRVANSQNNFAMAAGGGLDIKLNHAVTLRPIQLDYLLTRFEAPNLADITGPTSNRNQNDLRFATGLMFTFGGSRETASAPAPIVPPAASVAMKTCPDGSSIPVSQECPNQNMGLGLNVSQADVCAGATVRVTPAGTLPPSAVNEWSINGQPVNQAPAFDFGTAGRAPGTYRIGLRVTAQGYNDAAAETTVTVRGYQPPSGSLQASPAEIWVGDKAQLSADFRPGPCGGPLQAAIFTAAEGSVNGSEFDSTTVAFDPSNNSEQRKTVAITAKVSDSQGSGSADTQIVVKKRAALTAQRLPDIVFPANSTRVNNCGKRVLLEELKTYSDRDSTGTVVLVGHQSEAEKAAGLDLKRALNAAAVISAGSGICTAFPAAQIFLTAGSTDQSSDFQPHFCGTSAEGGERAGQSVSENDDSAKLRRVEVWFVPTNGKLPPSSVEHKDAASLGVSGLGCPR